MLKIAIAGGNIGASALISLLRGDTIAKLIGIYERKEDSPGVILATKWNIPVFREIEALCSSGPEIVINVAGDASVSHEIRSLSGNGIEVIESAGARFLWEIIEKQKRARFETFKTIENQKTVFDMLQRVSENGKSSDFLMFMLDKALAVAEAPAGSIAAYEGGTLEVIASKGLSERFIENNIWNIIPGGLSDVVIRDKKTIVIVDTTRDDFTRNNAGLMSENIRSMLACPLLMKNEVAGILFIDDFKPRKFSERQTASLNLMAGLIGVSIRWMRLNEKKKTLEVSLEEKVREFEELKFGLESKVVERTAELEKINRELDYANQLKGRFIANMSHELRTPLNSIIGFSDIILDKTFGDLTENQERYIRNIHTSGKHLLELINNVLDLAKIEAGKFEMSYETFYVDDVMSEVVDVMKPLASNKFIEIFISVSGDVGTVTADRVKMKQILYNLLSNAIKFTPEGGAVRVSVTPEPNAGKVSTVPEMGFLKFSVADTGIGIGIDDRERIFDEFEQAASSLSEKYGGVGLGLALTRKLVELHGGKITVESNLGEGSIFTFYLPVTAPVSEMPETEEIEAVSLNFPWMKEEAPLILVVEDDLSTAELLTLHLTQAGYKVAHAFNGEEAIRKARELRPFAITLDILLPKKDGWEVLQQLKSDQETVEIPVIIHSIVDNKDLAFALGATDYLLKPLDKEALFSKLEEITVARGKRSVPISILIIEAEDKVTDSFKRIFEKQGFFIYTAATGQRGIELATAIRPAVILLDFALPDMIGFDAITVIKDNPSTKDIPVFVLSEKDISVEDRLALVGKIERIVQKYAFDTKELIGHIKELEILYPKRAGLIDDATGVFSHRYFQIRLAQEVERARRYKLPLNMLLLDLDHFNMFLKNHGETFGNRSLRKVADLLRKNIRGSDVIVRYGGDSFAVILPNTVITAALSMSNRFNAIIKNYPFLLDDPGHKGDLTASIGLTFLDGQATEEFILCAEKALKQAREKGGDRVEVYAREHDETEEVEES